MVIMLEARNWEMRKTINTLTTTLATGSIRTTCQTSSNTLPTLFPMKMASTSVLSEPPRRRLINLRKSDIGFKNWDFSLKYFQNVVSYTYRNAVVYDFTLKCWPTIFVLLGKQKTSGSMQAAFTRKQLSQSELPTCLIARVQYKSWSIGTNTAFIFASLAQLVEQ